MQTVLGKLDDFDTQSVGPLSGAHGQQLVDALRKLDRKSELDSSQPHPGWDMVETWPAIVVGLNTVPNQALAANPVLTEPAMYWVRKQYVGSGQTVDPVNLYNALDDANMFYPATNVAELLSGTTNVQMGQPVLVFSYIDRGVTNRKRYLFITDRPTLYLKITTAMPSASMGSFIGGGGFYNARSVTKQCVQVDPTVAGGLIAPCSPNEEVAGTDDVLAENWAEANLGDPGSHWVQPDTFAPAWLVSYSNETPPRPVYRFYSPRPGPQAMLINISTPSGFGATTIAFGTGRYAARPMTGNAVNPDATTDFDFDDPGTNGGSNGSMPYAIWQNMAECRSAAPAVGFPTHSLQGRSAKPYVIGWFMGMTVLTIDAVSTPVPVYYGWAMCSVFSADLYCNPGTGSYGDDGTNTTQPTYAYDIYADGLVSAAGYQLAAAGAMGTSPEWQRQVNSPVGHFFPATKGLVEITATGQIRLITCNEQPNGFTGSFMDVALTVYDVSSGIIQV